MSRVTAPRRLARLVAVVSATAACLATLTVPASADPPEGCTGFPEIPEAYVCVESWTPENVVPTVGTGSTTVWVPEFCLFDDCVGPTPVDVPVPTVTVNEGEVARIRYRDQVYVIALPPTVPPLPPPLPGVGPAGEICGMVTSNDPTALFEQNPNVQSGYFVGGPWSGSDSTTSITITCWLQVNSVVPSGGNPSVTWTTPEKNAFFQAPMSFVASPTDNVYLCGRLEYQDASGYHLLQVDDDDDPANGVQCQLLATLDVVGHQYLG